MNVYDTEVKRCIDAVKATNRAIANGLERAYSMDYLARRRTGLPVPDAAIGALDSMCEAFRPKRSR